MIVRFRLNLLQELSSLAAVLSYEPTRISNEELPTLVTELASRNIRFITALGKPSEYFLKTTCDIIVDSDIVRAEQEDPIR